ncbi:hypothetical protein [Halosegnis sp.]|uniref:HVO_0234 family beta-propeller protein n=1 Tax=Halosegnis sp. TaxID=2864959 RepID=UPI0035D43C05
MSTDGDVSLDEKRVYAGGSAQTAFITADGGLVRVSVSGDLVGEFGLAVRESARDVACADGRVAAATETDALVATDDGIETTGFGPADAVGFADGLIAAGEDRIARYDGEDWTTLGQLADVRAVAGDLLAAAEGVHRLDGTHVGLSDARDVAVGRDVLAATDDGLYALANGWMQRRPGGFRAVATGGNRTVAVADDGTLIERRDGEWIEMGAPAVVDAAPTANAVYAVTAEGTVLADAGEGWRERATGVSGCRRLAVVSRS